MWRGVEMAGYAFSEVEGSRKSIEKYVSGTITIRSVRLMVVWSSRYWKLLVNENTKNSMAAMVAIHAAMGRFCGLAHFFHVRMRTTGRAYQKTLNVPHEVKYDQYISKDSGWKPYFAAEEWGLKESECAALNAMCGKMNAKAAAGIQSFL